LAKKPPINAKYIEHHLQYKTIKSIKKTGYESIHRPKCLAWNLDCKHRTTNEQCKHTVDVGGFPYQRFCNMTIKGDELLKQKTLITRSAIKSLKRTFLLNEYVLGSEEYKMCTDTKFYGYFDNVWYGCKKYLIATWIKDNAKKCDFTRCSDQECLTLGDNYRVSVIIPTQGALGTKTTLAPMVSVVKIGGHPTPATYRPSLLEVLS